jgi:putative tricarboxylic transport membrane protein
VLGYLLVRFDFPVAAVVLGLVLGPILESNLRNALIGSQMDPTIFLRRPISLAILVSMVLLLVVWQRQERRAAQLAAVARAPDAKD